MTVKVPDDYGPAEVSDDIFPSFRWPTVGDRLFASAAEWRDNALVTGDLLSKFAVMASGYKKAADQLVKTAMRDQSMRDFLVYPIIFCYRQYIELTLKHFLRTYGSAYGAKPNYTSHELEKLWTEFAKILEQVGNDDDDLVATHVKEYARVDPTSFYFRYPVTNKGAAIVIDFERVDLGQLADVMEGLENYFDGTDGLLAERQRA